jgi:hypothetical protein
MARGEASARARHRRVWAAAIAGVVLATGIAFTPAAHAARGFETGIYEPDFGISNVAAQTQAFDATAQARAGFALIYLNWRSIAPTTRPAGFDPANPADPAYKFASTDAAVRDAVERGMRVVLAFVNAPSWAEGPNRPPIATTPTGTWQPIPSEVGAFARALAIRYSGNFMGLPAVRYWQLWAEPNLGVNLQPQFIGTTPVGFNVYRPMLDAFYASLKAVSPQNVVIPGGTAPYGGLTPARGLTYQRMQPLTFWRGLLCQQVSKKKKKKKGKKRGRRATSSAAIPGCTPPRFDVAAHHPINVGAPTRRALNPNDASTPDIGKLRRVLRAGGAGSKPIWATEIWWNSNPPARGVPLKTQARYLSQSFYILWKQGVQAAFWFQVHDQQPNGRDPIPTCGLFFRDYQAKPALQAFRFPFAVERLSRSKVRVWGIAPGAGPVSISGRGGRLKTLAAGANRVFVGVLRLRGKARLRATQGSESSLVAPEFVVKKRR